MADSQDLEALKRAFVAAGIDPEAALDELRSKHGKAAPPVPTPKAEPETAA